MSHYANKQTNQRRSTQYPAKSGGGNYRKSCVSYTNSTVVFDKDSSMSLMTNTQSIEQRYIPNELELFWTSLAWHLSK